MSEFQNNFPESMIVIQSSNRKERNGRKGLFLCVLCGFFGRTYFESFTRIFKGKIKDTIIELLYDPSHHCSGGMSDVYKGYEGLFLLRANDGTMQSGKNLSSFFYLYEEPVSGLQYPYSSWTHTGAEGLIKDFERDIYQPIEAAAGRQAVRLGYRSYESAPIPRQLPKSSYVQHRDSGMLNNGFLSDLRLYPNPATNHLFGNVDFRNYDVSISDMTGRVLPISVLGYEIDISTLPAGVYCLRIKDNKGTVIRKFVKE